MKECHVQRQILDYLTAERIFALRLNTAAFKVDGRFFRAHTLGPGAADILVPAEGSVWIECKASTGRQSLAQKLFQERMANEGFRYILARSIDDLQSVL